MRFIDQIEPWPRGVYCDAIGVIEPCVGQAAAGGDVQRRDPNRSDRQVVRCRDHDTMIGQDRDPSPRGLLAPSRDLHLNTNRRLPDRVSRDGATDIATEQQHSHDRHVGDLGSAHDERHPPDSLAVAYLNRSGLQYVLAMNQTAYFGRLGHALFFRCVGPFGLRCLSDRTI